MLKKILISSAVLIFSVLLLGFIGQQFLRNKIDSLISESLPAECKLSYGDIESNVFTGDAAISDVSFTIMDTLSETPIYDIDIASLSIEGFSYSTYFKNHQFKAHQLSVRDPDIVHHRISSSSNDTSAQALRLPGRIQLEILDIGKGNYIGISSDSLLANQYFHGFNLKLKDIVLDSIVHNSAYPSIGYSISSITLDSLSGPLSDYEQLSTGAAHLVDGALLIRDLRIATAMSEQELLKKSPQEREYIELEIPEIQSDDFNLILDMNSIGIEAQQMNLRFMDLYVSLDKSAIERTAYRPLYSRQLRELGVEINVTQLSIDSSTIAYQERLESVQRPARINFDNVNCQIDNLHNHSTLQTETQIQLNCNFMGVSPLELFWRYDIHNTYDGFSAAVNLQNLDMLSVSEFFHRYASAHTEGKVNKLFFEIIGNDDSSIGSMKADYDGLKFDVLREGTSKTAHFKSTLTNLFIANDSDKFPDGYRYGEIAVEREQSKSFFNYLWLNARSGLQSAVLGDGRLEEGK